MEKWTTELIGSHIGKTALIIQGCEGIGLEVARQLARHGMRVIVCAEDVVKGEVAIRDLRSSMYGAVVSYEHVDLDNLESVKLRSDKILTEVYKGIFDRRIVELQHTYDQIEQKELTVDNNIKK